MADDMASPFKPIFFTKIPFLTRKISVLTLIVFALLPNVISGTNRYRDFASKTRYRYEERADMAGSEETSHIQANCKPIHINMITRHGTRNPSKKDVEKINHMLEVVNKLHDVNKPFQIGKLRLPWTNPFTDHSDKKLTETGEEELYDLGKRIRSRYPGFFKGSSSIEQLSFVSTNTKRCLKSAASFSLGLLEGLGRLGACKIRPVAVETTSIDSDRILRFFDLCPKYNQQVSGNESSLYEHHAFKYSQPMREVANHVGQRLGVNTVLSVEHVIGMHIACTFEIAVFDRHDTWCSVFQPEDLRVLEYFYDLKHYWKRGYGFNITYQSSCTLLVNIINTIKSGIALDNPNKKRAIFRFAHAETLQPLYGLLGLFKDKEVLRADNYHKHSQRQYRTSRISPFGANIAFVVYNCTNEDDNAQDSLRLQVLLNENPISLPCCGEGLTCPLDKFFHCFDHIVQSCNLTSLCSVTEENIADSNLRHEDL